MTSSSNRSFCVTVDEAGVPTLKGRKGCLALGGNPTSDPAFEIAENRSEDAGRQGTGEGLSMQANNMSEGALSVQS